MKAVVWIGAENFEIREVQVPKIKQDQVLVQIEAASICTTDFHYADFGCVPPIVPGHEVAGIIIETGRHVKTVQTGQRVTLDPVQRCGQCSCCLGGYEHLCLNARHLGDTDIPGGWGEYVAIDAKNVYVIEDSVTFEQAALTEPAAVCMESFKRADFARGQSVLIMGDGAFGFVHAILARIYGATKIIVAGHYDERLKRIAEKTGAMTCNTHHESLDDCLAEADIGPGIDLAIEVTGATQVPNIALKTLRPRGTMILFSYVWSPEILNLGFIHMKELNVLGACRSHGCFKKCIEMLSNGQLNLKPLIDIKVPLEEVDSAMKKLKNDKKSCFKALLIP